MDEDETREDKLDDFYHQVKQHILQYQSGSIGLFPLHTSGKNEESHVRDNIYCAMAVWALGLAYRHMDDSKGRAYELQQAAVKCMRGILFCYMRQADKVEQFKKNQLGHHSLHVKFNVNTGDTIASDSDWAHLQIDAVSLYLLTLVQMTASGLQIIYTNDEVDFVQNLVYYIERAYRTPDYGMWERGSKENVGHKELNASSIGMAKAALEAINGFNVYGMQGTSSSVIYVDPDAHNRNYTIMHSMLPVASSSKETDASLLMITGFPAFAVGDESLCQQVKAIVLEQLEGTYGLKRFLRDGYKCVLEDRNRRFYESRELQVFDGIESEWPFLFIYLALDALFKNDKGTADHYIKKLQDELLQQTDSGELIPHYFYVPKIYLEAERKKPHSQIRLPSTEEDGDIFLWGQSLLIIMNLLDSNFLDVNEIDPIGRHLSQSARTRYGYSSHRYSSFKVADSDVVVQVSLISESRNLQTTLATFGIETQTPQQVEPIQIWPPSLLVKVYQRLGINRKLGLSGRPPRPIGTLGSSKIYRIFGKTVVTYPKLLDESDFYMALDMSLNIDEIKTNLALTRNNWNMKGRPTLCLLLRERNLRGKQFHEALELLASFKRGFCGGVKVKLGRLQTLVSTAVVDHLDFIQADHNVRDLNDSEKDLEEARIRETEGVDFNPLTPGSSERHTLSRSVRMSRSLTVSEQERQPPSDEEDANPKDFVTKSRESLLSELHIERNVDRQMIVLQELLKREGEHFQTHEATVGEMIKLLYQQAAYDKKWSAVRRGAGLMKKLKDSLAPGITTILVSGKVVTIGVFGHEEKVIYEPLTPAAIQKILYSFCSPHDVREAVLQQEMVLYLASFIAVMPKVFEGMLKIRIGWIIESMKQRLASSGLGSLYAQSPSDVKALLKIILSSKGKFHGKDIAPRNPLQNRQLDGAMHRVPRGFYDKVWSILRRAPEGIKVSKHNILSQYPTISEMTHRERNFQLKVEELLSDISNPEYRQTVVELLVVLATILERNPEVELSRCIDLDELVDEAIELYSYDLEPEQVQVIQLKSAREQFYNTPRDGSGGTTTYMARAVVNKLLRGSACVSSNCYVS
ncbi:phosphorylase b kinase regulatory subunit beta-like isoform X1 [Montipora capricornis]|uniref:phosphorylase b kinase regulatory subunit beta-like isoform X1 n=1 Tax=Montipora capricornis TaxID=246305 RepID=UPI0035F1C5B1